MSFASNTPQPSDANTPPVPHTVANNQESATVPADTAGLDEGRRNNNFPLRDAIALMISPVAALWGGEISRESGTDNGIDNANRPTNALGASGVSGVAGIAKASGINGVENAAQKSDFLPENHVAASNLKLMHHAAQPKPVKPPPAAHTNDNNRENNPLPGEGVSLVAGQNISTNNNGNEDVFYPKSIATGVDDGVFGPVGKPDEAEAIADPSVIAASEGVVNVGGWGVVWRIVILSIQEELKMEFFFQQSNQKM